MHNGKTTTNSPTPDGMLFLATERPQSGKPPKASFFVFVFGLFDGIAVRPKPAPNRFDPKRGPLTQVLGGVRVVVDVVGLVEEVEVVCEKVLVEEVIVGVEGLVAAAEVVGVEELVEGTEVVGEEGLVDVTYVVVVKRLVEGTEVGCVEGMLDAVNVISEEGLVEATEVVGLVLCVAGLVLFGPK